MRTAVFAGHLVLAPGPALPQAGLQLAADSGALLIALLALVCQVMRWSPAPFTRDFAVTDSVLPLAGDCHWQYLGKNRSKIGTCSPVVSAECMSGGMCEGSNNRMRMEFRRALTGSMRCRFRTASMC